MNAFERRSAAPALSLRKAAEVSWIRRREFFNGEFGPALVNGLTREAFDNYRRAATHERIARMPRRGE